MGHSTYLISCDGSGVFVSGDTNLSPREMKRCRRSFQDDQENEANLFCEKRLKYLAYSSKQKQEEYLIVFYKQ